MAQKRILVVDDDSEIRNLLDEYLTKNGFDVITAENGIELDKSLSENDIDIIILDIMMPGEDGLQICQRLRGQNAPPIIMLTALSEDTDKIVGLEIGADDYLPKPFNPRELLARIKVILRRTENSTPDRSIDSNIISFDKWKLDNEKMHLISPDNIVVSLSGAEYKLLKIFIDHAGRVLSRDQLMDWIAGRENNPFDRSIDVQVSRLRQRLNDDGKIIKTVRGQGYIFTTKAEKVYL